MKKLHYTYWQNFLKEFDVIKVMDSNLLETKISKRLNAKA